MELKKFSDKIWTIENFLSKSECEDYIIFSEQKGYEEAKVSLPEGAKMIKGIRDNYRLMYRDEVLADKFWKSLQPFVPEKINSRTVSGLNELFRFYRYDSNQRFKRHIDGRFKKSDTEESRITFLIYLNDDYRGGETKFDDVIIKPKAGTALCFYHELKHEGSPVADGIKYVIRTDVMYKK